MRPDPIGAASRAAQRDRRFAGAPCSVCGESNPRMLDADQGHHVAGGANYPDLATVLCANHHRVQTSRLLDLGVSMDAPETLIDRIAALLAGAGEMLIAVGTAMVKASQAMMALMTDLDGWDRAWRQLPSAQP
jgi:hypothetical protein